MKNFVLLISFLSSLSLVAQNISGIVVNKENEPLIDATVYSHSLKKGTTTGASISSKLTIGLSANNLLDTEYIPHLSLLKEAHINEPRRNIIAKISYSF